MVQFIAYGVRERQHVIVLELMSMDLRTHLDDHKKKNGKENGAQGPPLPMLTTINIIYYIYKVTCGVRLFDATFRGRIGLCLGGINRRSDKIRVWFVCDHWTQRKVTGKR